MAITIFGSLEDPQSPTKNRLRRCFNCQGFRPKSWVCRLGYVQDLEDDHGNFAYNCPQFEWSAVEDTTDPQEKFCANCIGYRADSCLCYFGHLSDLYEDRLNRANKCRDYLYMEKTDDF